MILEVTSIEKKILVEKLVKISLLSLERWQCLPLNTHDAVDLGGYFCIVCIFETKEVINRNSC